MLAFYKQLIALRNNEEYADTIVYGETRPVMVDEKNIMAYLRCGADQTMLVIGNFDGEAKTVDTAEVYENAKVAGIADTAKVLLNNYSDCQIGKQSITLKPYQALALVWPVA